MMGALRSIPQDFIAADEWESSFPNSDVVHVLKARTRPDVEPTIAVLEAVAKLGARLVSLRSGLGLGATDLTLHLSCIAAGEARALSHRLAALDGVLYASVEHHIIRSKLATPD